MPIDQYLSKLANMVQVGRRSNAFAPVIWLTGIICFICIGGMHYFDDPIIKYTLLIIFIIGILYAMAMYIVLLVKDPRLLQSESFRIEDKKLDIISAKGSEVIVNPVNLTPPPTQSQIGGISNE
jgi:hypothetical protein